MNQRLRTLKKLIDDNKCPVIVDTSHMDPPDVYHWGDIEAIGYGNTGRYFDRGAGFTWITRNYTGPNSIKLLPQNVKLKTGESCED